MTNGVFFRIEALGREVDAANPETCSGLDTIMELLASLSSDGDFFGLLDETDTCLQVRFEDERNQYWVEVPRPDMGGSYGAHLNFDDAVKIFKDLPERFPNTGFQGFEFVSWGGPKH